MKIRYFAETDTLHVEFAADSARETRELDEDTLVDVDAGGRVCSTTLEHASTRTSVPQFSYEQVEVR